MTDTTLIQRLREDLPKVNEPESQFSCVATPDIRQAADALEQQAAQIAEKDAEIARLKAAPSVAPEPVTGSAAYVIQLLLAAGYVAADKVAQAEAIARSVDCEAANPPRAPLSDEHVYAVVRSVQPHLATTSKAWRELAEDCRYWLKAERAVTEAAHGIRGQG